MATICKSICISFQSICYYWEKSVWQQVLLYSCILTIKFLISICLWSCGEIVFELNELTLENCRSFVEVNKKTRVGVNWNQLVLLRDTWMRSKSNYTHCSLSGSELSFNTGTLLKQMIEAIQQFMSCEKGEIDTDLIYLNIFWWKIYRWF